MDKVKMKQALQELGLTALVAFGLPFLGYLSGLSELPNLDALEAATRAGVLAAIVSIGKGGLWYLTGTKVLPSQSPLEGGKVAIRVDEAGHSLVEIMVAAFFGVLILVVLFRYL